MEPSAGLKSQDPNTQSNTLTHLPATALAAGGRRLLRVPATQGLDGTDQSDHLAGLIRRDQAVSEATRRAPPLLDCKVSVLELG